MNTRPNSFARLEALCAAKEIVCERRGKKIELTTPCGGTTAECDSVAEALDTVQRDSTFADLPLKLMNHAAAAPRATEYDALVAVAEVAQANLDLHNSLNSAGLCICQCCVRNRRALAALAAVRGR